MAKHFCVNSVNHPNERYSFIFQATLTVNAHPTTLTCVLDLLYIYMCVCVCVCVCNVQLFNG